MALHGVLVLGQQLLPPTNHHHTFHLAVSRQSILVQLPRSNVPACVCVCVHECGGAGVNVRVSNMVMCVGESCAADASRTATRSDTEGRVMCVGPRLSHIMSFAVHLLLITFVPTTAATSDVILLYICTCIGML